MYTASDALHAAVLSGAPQYPLIEYATGVMTAQDISISGGGIQIDSDVMEEEDYAPGSCMSATISLSVLNDEDQWSDFTYGEGKVYIGVQTASGSYSSAETCRIDLGDDGLIQGLSYSPYLTFNGTKVSGITAPVLSLILLHEKLIVFTKNTTTFYKYTASGLTTPYNFNYHSASLAHAAVRWKEKHIGASFGHKGSIGTAPTETNNLLIFQQGAYTAYEMVPMGIFDIDRPVYSSNATVSATGYDRMQLLDTKYVSGDISFPISLNGIVSAVCTKLGITWATGSLPVNGGLTVNDAPDNLDNDTYREILQWCAEAGGCFCRMNREGKLETTWFKTAGYTVDEGGYTEYNQAYYTAAPVETVAVRESEWKYDDIVGTGVDSTKNVLWIQNNPLILNLSDTASYATK